MPNSTDVTCASPCISKIHEPINATHGIFRCSVIQQVVNSENQNCMPEGENKQLALKSFTKSRKNEERDPETLQRNKNSFRREYELLASFKDSETNAAHAHIVSVVAYLETYPEYGPLFVMELAEHSLYDVLKNDRFVPTGDGEGKFSFSHCINFLHQITKALTYLHEGIRFNNEVRPIIHRDLKSCNILLFNQGRDCKLGDFDISRPVEDTMTGRVGTPGWRAPELTMPSDDGRLSYTVAADCFSFGAVCLEVLFREIPEKIGKIYSPTDHQSEKDVRFFCEPSEKVVSLSDSTFAESAAFHHNMACIKDLLLGLFAANPIERITARGARTKLKALAPLNVSPLYGLEAAHECMHVGEREVSDPIILENASTALQSTACTELHSTICTSEPSDFVSVFYEVESFNRLSRTDFDEDDKKRIQLVMELMVVTLNTLASPKKEPCTAKFCICLTEEEPNRLILEIKIRQNNQREISVVDWCRNNEKQCTRQLKSFFEEDPTVKLQSLKFRMRIPELFMPDRTVETDGASVPSLIRRVATRTGSFLSDLWFALLYFLLELLPEL